MVFRFDYILNIIFKLIAKRFHIAITVAGMVLAFNGYFHNPLQDKILSDAGDTSIVFSFSLIVSNIVFKQIPQRFNGFLLPSACY